LYKSLKLCMCTPIGLDPRIENWLFNFPINVSGPHKERQSLVMNHVVSMPGEVEWLNGCVYASNSILSFTVWDCCSWCYRFHKDKKRFFKEHSSSFAFYLIQTYTLSQMSTVVWDWGYLSWTETYFNRCQHVFTHFNL